MADNEHIFVSYRSIEAPFALKLAADLKNRGIHVWMDRLEMGIKGGDDWRRAIEQAVNTCRAMISVLSPEYVTSEYCRNELARANRLGRAIFPVLLSPVESKIWPIELERILYIDFRNWQDENTYRLTFNDLLLILEEKSASQIGNLPDVETQYLTSLIAELESRRGVLEYVDLAGQSEAAERPDPRRDEGWNAEFSLLLSENAATFGPEKKRKALSSIRQAIEQHPRFVLIGEPGAGKTTTLRKLALDAARKRLANPRTAPLPLLIFPEKLHQPVGV